jgi:hypothetical protein
MPVFEVQELFKYNRFSRGFLELDKVLTTFHTCSGEAAISISAETDMSNSRKALNSLQLAIFITGYDPIYVLNFFDALR